MSSVLLQRRRGCDDCTNDDDGGNGLEEGRFSANELSEDDRSSATDTVESSKKARRRWQQVKVRNIFSWLFFAFTVVVVVVVVIYLMILHEEVKIPRLPVPNVDITVPKSKEWPLVHIVSTRFMQEQGPLETLGIARLKLFLTFCLPSMVNQSSQKFFWIIKTDPKFTTTSAFKLLTKSVQPYDNIYIVASNINFLFGTAEKGSWRDGKEAFDLIGSKKYTGNLTKLNIAMALRNERPILETRLDADDGLHEHFIKYLQAVAMKRFQPYKITLGRKEVYTVPIPQWLYWCSRRHIEWHSDTDKDPSLSKKQKEKIGSIELGYMNVIQHDKICVTPGITIGFNIGTNNVPQYDHDKLYRNVRHSLACYEDDTGNSSNTDDKIVDTVGDKAKKSPCLELVEDLNFCAIRSRTWTSAGMYNIDLVEKDILRGVDQKEFTDKLWTFSKDKFGVNKTRVMETQNFLIKNKKMIAYENLIGQCTSGHSCKHTAKEELKRIVEDGEK